MCPYDFDSRCQSHTRYPVQEQWCHNYSESFGFHCQIARLVIQSWSAESEIGHGHPSERLGQVETIVSSPFSEQSFLWAILSLCYPFSEPSFLWAILSLSYPFSMLSFLWAILSLSYPFSRSSRASSERAAAGPFLLGVVRWQKQIQTEVLTHLQRSRTQRPGCLRAIQVMRFCPHNCISSASMFACNGPCYVPLAKIFRAISKVSNFATAVWYWYGLI